MAPAQPYTVGRGIGSRLMGCVCHYNGYSECEFPSRHNRKVIVPEVSVAEPDKVVIADVAKKINALVHAEGGLGSNRYWCGIKMPVNAADEWNKTTCIPCLEAGSRGKAFPERAAKQLEKLRTNP